MAGIIALFAIQFAIGTAFGGGAVWLWMRRGRKEERLVKVGWVAEFLDVPGKGVFQMCRQGIIPHTRIGRRVRFSKKQIEDWSRKGGKALAGGWRRG